MVLGKLGRNAEIFHFHDVARLPMAGDNVAIATRRLEAGTEIMAEERTFRLDYTVLEGHRFAAQPIARDEALLSWGLPFGIARQEIAPGSYVCNPGMLEALRGRSIDFELPAGANFEDAKQPYVLDEHHFQPAEQVPSYTQPRTFWGYRRDGGRGVGTRNYIILLGVTSLTSGYARQLEARLKGVTAGYDNIDGIVAVTHTEGGHGQPNNLELLLRTLAGFVIHPNVGAVLLVDYGSEAVTNAMLRDYMIAHHYPVAAVIHRFFSLQDEGKTSLSLSYPNTSYFEQILAHGEAIVRGWLDEVNRASRSEEPLAELKIALQCGGSDAFSGISGNPLAAWVAKEIIRYGGAANLAETDELLGAERYLLQKVKNIETVHKFLATVERFKTWMGWHGASAEGNTSGGNKFRGLYNNSLKSIGAAMKRHPEVRLDGVIDYGELMPQPGFYFMDSPGNDLESIAGQVASGCNMIFFVTGNGSITNFPFAPTIKIVTTTQRYELLSQEMDVNAGAYLDGRPLEALGQEMLDLTIAVASGQRSVGEQAGHAQTQIWRDWPQTSATNLERLLAAPQPDGKSLPIKAAKTLPKVHFQVMSSGNGYAAQQIGLIMPTSLCSGQIARLTAERLNQKGLGRDKNLARFVSLVHTEGCGASSGASEALYMRVLLGYLTHPLVRYALLLEHGCEKTHNDYIRRQLQQCGLDPEQFGWASIQLDGGIERVMVKIEQWFSQSLSRAATPAYETVGLEAVRLGLVTNGPISTAAAQSLAELTRQVVGAGGSVVVPHNMDLLDAAAYWEQMLGHQAAQPTLAYGQSLTTKGFHLMEAPSLHWVETLAGLGATGVEIIIAYAGAHPLPGHPLIPVLQITASEQVSEHYGYDLDLILAGAPDEWPDQILQLIVKTLSGARSPKLDRQGNLDFQISRGLLGISL